MIPTSVMTYKQFCKEHLLLARLAVLRARLVQRLSIKDIVCSFTMGRNTVTRLCTVFEKSVPDLLKAEFCTGRQYTKDEVLRFAPYLLGKSRRPHHHPKIASSRQETFIQREFEVLRVGWKQMHMILSRRKTVGNLTRGMIKGIYKRKKFKIRRVRVKKGLPKPLYDYKALGIFEKMHYDTKELLDLKALPPVLYEKLEKMKEAPKFLWNLMDAKSRFRFIAFSKTRTATFGWGFLLCVVFYLRHMGYTHHICIGMDNGSEFCAGSEKKEAEWNQKLAIFNASVYSYHPRHDVRKNLIERSHGTDDSHYLLAALPRCSSAEDLFREGQNYWKYFNWERQHTGIEMHDRTPAEVIADSHLFPNPQRLQAFPVLFLDHEMDTILSLIETLQFFNDLHEKALPDGSCQKKYLQFLQNYPHVLKNMPNFAPNVLDYHHSQYF